MLMHYFLCLKQRVWGKEGDMRHMKVLYFGLGLWAITSLSHLALADEKEKPLGQGVIGITLAIEAKRVGEPGVLVARSVFPKSPAAEAEMQPGDQILAIEDQSVKGLTSEEIVQKIRGEAGTLVRLKIKFRGQETTVVLKRIDASQLEAKVRRQTQKGEEND